MDNKIIRLNYIGSKHNLFEFIKNNILDFTNWNNLNNKIIGDLFSGTGIVSYNLRNEGSITISNDAELYSYYIVYSMTKCTYNDNIKNLIIKFNNIINSGNLIEGFITKNYSPFDTCTRKYFTIDNAKKIDTYRQLIEQENYNNIDDKYFLLASLLVCADNVSNIPAVYGCYLKNFKNKALKTLVLEPVHMNIKSSNVLSKVFNSNIMSNNIYNENYDCVYLDPPYNQRQYSKNYHVLNMIALYNNYPEIHGITGLPNNSFISPFCSKKTILTSLDELIKNIKSSYIFMSYSSEGLITINEILEIFNKYGTTKVYNMEYKRFKSFKYNETGKLIEYVIALKKINLI